MIEQLVATIETYLLPLGAWGVFGAAFLEEVIAPIPSAFVLLLSGFLFLEGPFSAQLMQTLLFTLVIPAAVGMTLGSLIIYGLAYIFGKPIVDRWGKWLGFSWDHIEKLQNILNKGKRDDIIIVGLRIFPFVPNVAISIFCGLVRFPLRTYALLTLVGSAVRAFLLGLLGWQTGELYYKYADMFGKIEDVILVLLAVAIAIFVLYRIRKRRVLY